MIDAPTKEHVNFWSSAGPVHINLIALEVQTSTEEGE